MGILPCRTSLSREGRQGQGEEGLGLCPQAQYPLEGTSLRAQVRTALSGPPDHLARLASIHDSIPMQSGSAWTVILPQPRDSCASSLRMRRELVLDTRWASLRPTCMGAKRPGSMCWVIATSQCTGSLQQRDIETQRSEESGEPCHAFSVSALCGTFSTTKQ